MRKLNQCKISVLSKTIIASSMAVSLIGATALTAVGTPPQGPDLSSAEVARAPDGAVLQVTPAEPVKPSAGAAAAETAAKEYAPALAKAFDAAGVGQLVVKKTLPMGKGSIVRLEQVIAGVPVFGASVAQSLTKEGALISALGSTTKRFTGSYPVDRTRTLAQAKESAAATVVEKYGVASAKVMSAEAYWFDPTLTKDAANVGSLAVPAYKVELAGAPGESWVVFVEAGKSVILDSWSQSQKLSSRVVCDANRYIHNPAAGSDVTCGDQPALFREARVEGQRPSKIADVNRVFDALGDAQNFFAANTTAPPLAELAGTELRAGQRGGDKYGKAIRAVTRLCVVDNWAGGVDCPYPNAAWDTYTSTIIVGESMATDDIVGHEVTHGINQETNGLIYRGQSGAINESLSDTFGEFIDLSNGSADDTAANRWKIGEGSAVGIGRDMANPPAYGQPDSMSSPLYDRGQRERVHINSGVGNKTAYLIADGGTFGGQSIEGIGIRKAAQLYWTALSLLPSNADYGYLGAALKGACQQNRINGTMEINSNDCNQVADAVKATGIG